MTDGTRLVADVYRPVPKAGQPATQPVSLLVRDDPVPQGGAGGGAATFFPARAEHLSEGRGTPAGASRAITAGIGGSAPPAA